MINRKARKQCFRVTPGKQTNKKVFLPTLAQEIGLELQRAVQPICIQAVRLTFIQQRKGKSKGKSLLSRWKMEVSCMLYG